MSILPSVAPTSGTRRLGRLGTIAVALSLGSLCFAVEPQINMEFLDPMPWAAGQDGFIDPTGIWLNQNGWYAGGGSLINASLATITQSFSGESSRGFLHISHTPQHNNIHEGSQVETRPLMSVSNFRHGYYEARMKISNNPGGGAVGFFLYATPAKSGDGMGKPEFDIEFLLNEGWNGSSAETGKVHFTTHGDAIAKSPTLVKDLNFNPSRGFHRYGMLWKVNGSLDYYIDGKFVVNFTNDNINTSRSMMMMVNTWSGNADWGGGPPSTNSTTYVDWIRHWPGVTSLPYSDNVAPVAAAQSVTTSEDVTKSITLSATDSDGNALTYAIYNAPTHGTLTGTGSARVYTPAANYNGSDSFSFVASDGTANSAPALVSITVTAVNDAPRANGQAISTNVLVDTPITLTGSDVDGDALSYLITQMPAGGNLIGAGSTTLTRQTDGSYLVNGAPNLIYRNIEEEKINGSSDSIVFTVSDGRLTSTKATVAITIAPKPHPIQVNFQPASSPVPVGWLPDSGLPYATRNGQTYGWNKDLSAAKYLRDRNHADSLDQQHDTHLLVGDSGMAAATWEMAVPNGSYYVVVVMGDPRDAYMPDDYRCVVEGTTAINGTATTVKNWLEAEVTVTVADGKLSLLFPGGATVTNKVCSVEFVLIPATSN